ncbi:MAG: phosphatase PAP2 family protein [Candidatus Pacebacteria bacterium]|nr:phosphatase PAP2 family protein [Candidatus Paceibacterota bacterium]
MDGTLVEYAHSIIGRVPFMDGLAVFFASYLPYLFVIAFIVCLYANDAFLGSSPLARKQARLRFILRVILALLIASGIITPFIHYLYGRARPFAEFNWTPLFAHEATPSFPSSHATLMFTLAASIWQLRKKWGYWFFATAALTGFARVYSLVHYPSDIICGALIGIFVVYFVNLIARFR